MDGWMEKPTNKTNKTNLEILHHRDPADRRPSAAVAR